VRVVAASPNVVSGWWCIRVCAFLYGGAGNSAQMYLPPGGGVELAYCNHLQLVVANLKINY